MKSGHDFDVAVSFAGEQRLYVERFVAACGHRGLRVFYDRNEVVALWGRNLVRALRAVYGGGRAQYFMPFLSADYLAKPYPMDEFNAAIAEALDRADDDYILPVIVGDVPVPADLLNPTVAFLRVEEHTPEELAELFHQKVRRAVPDRSYSDCTHAAHALLQAVIPQEPITQASLTAWKNLHRHAQELAAHLPPEHPDTLRTRRVLARWTGLAGDTDRAMRLYTELLPLHQRVLGDNHPYTLAVRHHQANWIGHAKDPPQAQRLLARLLPVQKQTLGADHSDTLATFHARAWWTGEAGDPAEARDLYEQLLTIRHRVSGIEHLDTIRAWHNLAYWTGNNGDVQRARDLFADLIPLAEQALSSDHRRTLNARNGHAFWTGVAGKATRARDVYHELLPICQRMLGVEDRDTLFTHHYLALWSAQAGDLVTARDLAAELLPIRERTLGANHRDTIATRQYLRFWQSAVNSAN